MRYAGQSEIRVRREIAGVEILLLQGESSTAESAARRLIRFNLVHKQLAELGDLFGRSGQSKVAEFFFDLCARSSGLTASERYDLEFR